MKVALFEGKRVIKVNNNIFNTNFFLTKIKCIKYAVSKEILPKVKKTRLLACQDRIDFQVFLAALPPLSVPTLEVVVTDCYFIIWTPKFVS